MKYLKEKILLWMFKRYFGEYVFPFQDGNKYIEKLPVDLRIEFFRQIKLISESEAMRKEFEHAIRGFMSDIAYTAPDKEMLSAYRLTLQFIKDFEQRLVSLGRLYEPALITERTKIEGKMINHN